MQPVKNHTDLVWFMAVKEGLGGSRLRWTSLYTLKNSALYLRVISMSYCCKGPSIIFIIYAYDNFYHKRGGGG